MLHVELFDTKTGASRLKVDSLVSAASWARRLTGNGQGRFTFKTDGLTAARVDALFRERERTVAVHDGTSVAFAGVIMSTDWDDASRSLTVETVEIRAAIRWRMLAGVANITDGSLKATGLSAAAAVGRIVQRATQWAAAWALPFDYTTTGGGDFVLNAEWYEFRYAEDMIQEVEKRGIEVDFHPVLSSGSLRWSVRVAPKITAGVVTLPVKAGKTLLIGLKYKTDATDQVTGVLARGGGEGTDTVTAWAGNSGSSGIPIADVIRDAGDVSDPVELQKIANATFNEQQARVVQWSFDVRTDDPVAPLDISKVLPGRGFKLSIRSHPRIPDGDPQVRVIAVSGGLGRTVKTEVQPW